MWEVAFFKFLRILLAPVLGIRLLAIYQRHREVLAREINRASLVREDIECLARIEQEVATAQLHFPTAKQIIVEIALLQMQDLLRVRQLQVSHPSPNGNQPDEKAVSNLQKEQ